jgi:glycosyltransferase involved in cell wall biosynthesis
MLATADVLLVLLEPDAGTYSVPSKVLTYHCAGRAVLGAMPSDNLASKIITTNGSGIVVEPGDAAAFIEAAHRLVNDPDLRGRMGRAARGYAETSFDIDVITDRFTRLIHDAAGIGC